MCKNFEAIYYLWLGGRRRGRLMASLAHTLVKALHFVQSSKLI